MAEAQKDVVAKRAMVSTTNPFTNPDDMEGLGSPNDIEMMALSSRVDDNLLQCTHDLLQYTHDLLQCTHDLLLLSMMTWVGDDLLYTLRNYCKWCKL